MKLWLGWGEAIGLSLIYSGMVHLGPMIVIYKDVDRFVSHALIYHIGE